MNEQKNEKPGDVLIAAGEDVPEMTISPRLIAMGADTSRVHFLYGRTGTDGKPIPWNVSDVVTLKDAIQQIKDKQGELKLFIIDPLENFIGGDVDTYRNNEVRNTLRGLMDLAQEENFTILAVQHLNKTSGTQSIYRIAGSIAFAAAARTVWVVTKDKETPGGFLFANSKMNIAKKAPTYRYTIQDVDGIGIPAWGGIATVDAESAMNGTNSHTPAQDEVLDMIRKNHPAATKFSDIVTATGKSKGNVGNILKGLENSGLVKKSTALPGFYSFIETKENGSFIHSEPIEESEQVNTGNEKELDIF
jgi:hypothetical protein